VGIDAALLAGLMADPARRRVVAALILGATTTADVREATGLDARAAGRALSRLVDADLVVRDEKGFHYLVEEAFGHAARAAAPTADAAQPDEHGDATPEVARVLRAFVRDGRLLSIPTVRAKRLVILDLLAQEFEPGRRYSERRVNTILGRWHEDTAALRRYLVDEEFMEREAGEYWRAGGTFHP